MKIISDKTSEDPVGEGLVTLAVNDESVWLTQTGGRSTIRRLRRWDLDLGKHQSIDGATQRALSSILGVDRLYSVGIDNKALLIGTSRNQYDAGFNWGQVYLIEGDKSTELVKVKGPVIPYQMDAFSRQDVYSLWTNVHDHTAGFMRSNGTSNLELIEGKDQSTEVNEVRAFALAPPNEVYVVVCQGKWNKGPYKNVVLKANNPFKESDFKVAFEVETKSIVDAMAYDPILERLAIVTKSGYVHLYRPDGTPDAKSYFTKRTTQSKDGFQDTGGRFALAFGEDAVYVAKPEAPIKKLNIVN